MNREHYYLHVYRKKANNAGCKAVDDCEQIMRSIGYKELPYLLGTPGGGFFGKIKKVMSLLKINDITPNAILVVEHPLYIHNNYLYVLRKLKARKKIKLVFIIHDLESVRQILPDSELYEARDKIVFEIADVIIAHNPVMKELLAKNGVDSKKIVNLGIFDYLVRKKEKEITKQGTQNGIVIAGNLDITTCGYIYLLSETILNDMDFNLYGINYKETKGCHYYGAFTPNELPQIMQGKYGLIWYGNDLETCGGKLKEYLHYINPHKTSSYIAAGIPIIIADNIGLKDFIEQNELGFSIMHLSDLKEKLNSITDEQYKLYQENVKKFSKKLKNGEYLKTALAEADKIIG